DGTWGYNARDRRGGQDYPCRLTMYSGALPHELRALSELAREVGEAFQHSWASEEWEAQFWKAGQTPPDFLIKTDPLSKSSGSVVNCCAAASANRKACVVAFKAK